MTSDLLYLFVGAAVWAIGLQGLLLVKHILRRVIAVNLMGSGVFLVMVALAARSSPPDPVLQALVVTGLVVAFSATAFAVRLASARAQYEREYGPEPELEPEPEPEPETKRASSADRQASRQRDSPP